MSAPPSLGGCSGPPLQSQYLSACSVIHPATCSFSSVEMRTPGSATPWRILCTVLVIRKTPGFGFGTYLGIVKSQEKEIVRRMATHQRRSTPTVRANRTRACLMSATPPPCGVLLKNAILVFRALRLSAYFIVTSQVEPPQVCL